MNCRIGITTDLGGQKAYCESIYKNLSTWQIIDGPLDTKEEAQAIEDELVPKHGCQSHREGGISDDPDAPWYVYYFIYDGKK